MLLSFQWESIPLPLISYQIFRILVILIFHVHMWFKVSSKKYEDELMAGSDEDSHDAYLEQMKAEGAERDDDDSESSEGGLSVY